MDFPAYTIEHWNIDQLKPYARNARTHPQTQIEQLRASLRQFGWTMPILVRQDGTIIAGHARLQAAQLERMTQVPVIVASNWSEAQCRAYTIADNKIADGSNWHDDALLEELLAIKDDFDAKALGFEDKELMKLIADAEPPVPQLLEGLAYSVIIRCRDEHQQTQLLQRFGQEGLNCEALIS
jgi:ParB-like chromosome segregation protein Spo0J